MEINCLNVEGAVIYLKTVLSKEELATISKGSKKDMINYHHGLGTVIRNSMGLWGDNDTLKEDCLRILQKTHPERISAINDSNDIIHADDASGVILDALWEDLQKKA